MRCVKPNLALCLELKRDAIGADCLPLLGKDGPYYSLEYAHPVFPRLRFQASIMLLFLS